MGVISRCYPMIFCYPLISCRDLLIFCCYPAVILRYPIVILCYPAVILCYPTVILCYPAVILCYPAVILVIRLLSLLSSCYPCYPAVILVIRLLSLISGCYPCYHVIRYTDFGPVITPWPRLSKLTNAPELSLCKNSHGDRKILSIGKPNSRLSPCCSMPPTWTIVLTAQNRRKQGSDASIDNDQKLYW